MPTTRRQTALQKTEKKDENHDEPVNVGEKRDVEAVDDTPRDEGDEEPPSKKAKAGEDEDEEANEDYDEAPPDHKWQPGTIERGHIYFFYRPRVEHDEAHSVDDVQRFHILLVPRPPAFAVHQDNGVGAKSEAEQDIEMAVLSEGADVVPAAEPRDKDKNRFRIISVGKKKLPHTEGGGHGKGRKETIWATVTTVGNDLHKMSQGLGEKTYETKTRGTRHQASSRLAGRGAYAIVNNNPSVPSKRETHLGYHLSHPSEQGKVQTELGIYTASSFVLQVRNPLTPVSGGQRVGLSEDRRAHYSEEVMRDVFGKGSKGTNKSQGLRFASIPRVDVLDHEGGELLLIAARAGSDGVEKSLGEGRGKALEKAEKKDSKKSTEDVFKGLSLDLEKFPAEALEGDWI